MSGLLNIQNSYTDTQTRIDKTNLAYIEIRNDMNPRLVSVGPPCNRENPGMGLTVFSPNADLQQYWTVSDDVNNSLQNAAKVANGTAFDEETRIRTLNRVPGLYVSVLNNITYASGDTNLFLENMAGSINNQFNSVSVGASTAVDLFGYFCPNVTGAWEFTIPSYMSGKLYSKLWISNDNAVYDYTNTNADICNDENLDGSTGDRPVTNSFTIQLTAQSIVPIRIQIITTSSYNSSSGLTFLTVKPPPQSTGQTGQIISGNTATETYFVCLSADGTTPYYKQLTYFAMVSDNSDKYKTWFLVSSPDTYKKLRTLKLNDKYQYISRKVSTPINDVVKGAVSKAQTATTAITAPPGVPLKITNAVYGQAPYVKTVPSTQIYTEKKDYPGGVKTVSLATGSTFNNKPATLNVQPYTKSQTYTQTVYNTEYIPQTKTVTGQTQALVNQNSLNIDPNKYGPNFGNPAVPESTGTNTLDVEYSYVPDQSKYTDKQIYIDTVTGQLMIKYQYSGTTYTAAINMTYAPPVWNNPSQPCPYKLILDTSDSNNVKLAVSNGGNTVGYLTILSSSEDGQMAQALPNRTWANNTNCSKGLAAGTALTEGGQTSLISADAKYKVLITANHQVSVMYCIQPYLTAQSGDREINYTTPKNLDNQNQIYYFYRITTRGIVGKKFLAEMNTQLKVKDLHYLPNNSPNVLSYANMNAIPSAHLITPDGYNNQHYNIIQNQNQQQCETSCATSTTCDHAFLMNTASGAGGTCYVDNQNNSTPLYSTTRPANYTGGTLLKKNYSIANSCVSNQSPNYSKYNYKVQYEYFPDQVSEFTLDYTAMQNRPELTYYCGLPWYQNNVAKIDNIYGSQSTVAAAKQEGFDTQCANQTCFQRNVQTLTPLVNKFSTTQDSISQTYNKTQQDLQNFADLSNNLANPIYKYSGGASLIPSIYANDRNPQPETTILDGQLKDLQQNLLVQNTMFTLASITAATCLLLAIFVARE